ncbi:MAG: hypothetical protein ACKOI2_07485 [Actinomycetota bacterium]
MTQTKRLNWEETPEGWLVEIDDPVPDEQYGWEDNYAGARYKIRQHGSPTVFELRWMWVPLFGHLPPAEREEQLRRYKEFHWTNRYLVRDFSTLDEAMRFAEEQEEYRLEQGNTLPSGVLEGLRYRFQSDIDGTRWFIVEDDAVDMTGWKIETISLSLGTRSIAEFEREPWRGQNPWVAICDWGECIVRWIPPGGDARR